MNIFKDRAFLAAVVLLAVAASGRLLAPAMGLALTKLAVPWPDGVTVNGSYRNTSFPETIGHYSLVKENGELYRGKDGKPTKHGATEGENIYNKEDLGTLGMGSGIDEKLIKQRASNWYFSRIYRDNREGPSSMYRYWRLDVTYYTGGLDTVPHISINCLVAGGASIEKDGESQTFNVLGVPAPWNSLKCHRTVYNMKRDRRMQYYIFSYNGEPETSRDMVRFKLMDPFQKYVYFAKIQFEPCSAIEKDEETDRRTQEFIKSCLPIVLKDLPTPEDVRKLEAAKSGR